jgi:HemY protein
MALATLNQLITSHPKHDYVMRLMSRAYLQLEDWSHLCPLLKDLKQSKALPEEVLVKTEIIAYSGYLQQAGQQKDTAKLDSIWTGMPKYLKKNTDIIALYATQLIDNDQLQSAEKILRERLNKHWDDSLITLYARFINNIQTDNIEAYFSPLLDNCEKWLRASPHHATLLLIAGKISTVLKLWGKARTFFDSSLASQPLVDTYLQVALLLEQMDDDAEAQKYYQQGLHFCLSSKSHY